jgi:hypothetical protein
MTSSIESKMYSIAKYLDELNPDGKVKGFKGNEKGYAKILEIKRGCALWVHHLKDDRMIIDLMITDAAGNKYPEIAKQVKEKFEDFFNYMSNDESWVHSMNTTDALRFYVDITNLQFDEIVKVIVKLKSEFENTLISQ